MDSSTKSNAEVARRLVSLYAHSGSMVPIIQELRSDIESALATAQSNLAKDVLAEIDRNSRGIANDVKASDIANRLRDLFTRMGVKIES